MAHRPSRQASGRFLLRLPPPLHRALQAAAEHDNVSLNEYCVRRLAVGGSGLSGHASAPGLVLRAAELLEDALVAVVLYGSLARGESAPHSDADVLVVVGRSVPLERSLYRRWDERPIAWEGRPVDPHFVHLPDSGTGSGLWGEVAIDGIVLFERGVELSTCLTRVRQAIADGRIVRRVVHGQPYWMDAA